MNAISTVTAATAAPAAATVMFERKPLADALAFVVKRVIEARNTIPITGAVLIQSTDDGARLTGTDLDIHLSTVVPAAWDVPGAFAIDARAALAAVKAAAGDMVTLDATGRVSDGVLSTRCDAFAASDFPLPAAVTPAARFALDAATLAHDLERVRSCVSSEETRYYLNGIFLHAPRGKDGAALSIDMAATDGHRLAHIRRDLPAMDGDLPGTILPRKAIDAIRAALGKKPAGSIPFEVEAVRFVVEAGGWRIQSKTIDGTFPDYTRVMPARVPGLTMTADGEALARVLRAVTISNGKKGGGVKLHHVGEECRADYQVTLSGGQWQVAASASIAAAWSDDRAGERHPAWLSFNAAYLAPMADMLAGPVVIESADTDTPARVTTPAAPELTFVLMPMRPLDVAAQVKAGTYKPRTRPVVVPVESDSDVFDRTYRAAFEANDGPAMAAAVAAYRASDHCQSLGARLHEQIAMAAAGIRCRVVLAREGGNGRHVIERGKLYRAAKRDRAILRMGETWRAAGSLAFLRTSEERRVAVAADRAAKLAALAALPGYRADDERAVVPVVTTDGKRRFVKGEMLRNVLFTTTDILKADGTYPRGRHVKRLDRRDIARIVPDRTATPVVATPPAASVESVEPVAAVTAPPAPVDAPMPAPAPAGVDVAALVATVEALAARVAELEAASVAPAPAPVAAPAAPVAGDDGRDAYIATLIAERDALRIERDAAVAECEAIRDEGGRAVAALDISKAMVHGLLAARTVTAGRMRQLRSASRTAAAAATHAQDALARVTDAARADRAELARLRPLAAAIAAFTAPAAAPVDDDPFTRHGGQPVVAPATVAA